MASFRALWWAFFALGTINNLSYVFIATGQVSLATGFKQVSVPPLFWQLVVTRIKVPLLGLITWANVGLGLVARAINTWYLGNTSVTRRIAATSIMFAVGVAGVAVSPLLPLPPLQGFIVCLASIVVVGVASSLGESVLLGYMRLFPAEVVGGWSSGTGMSGVSGAALYFAMSLAGLSDSTIFFIQLVTAPLFMLVFLWVQRNEPPAAAADVSLQSAVSSPSFDGSTAGEKSSHLRVRLLPAEENSPQSTETPFQRNMRCFRVLRFYALQLAAVYMFEYIIQTAGAHSANTDCVSQKTEEACGIVGFCTWDAAACGYSSSSEGQINKSLFVVLAFCYQFGVLLSRSSLNYVKVRRVEILTTIQLLNLVLWIAQDLLRFMNVWVQFVLMVWVGLMGGASYVNTFYLLLNHKDVPAKDKDIVVNITALFINLGIVAAAVIDLVLYQTLLKKTV